MFGDGPIDLVYVPTWVFHVEVVWEHPAVERFFNRVGSFARVILFDRRGAGLSDPLVGAPTLEQQMDDVLAVMDAAGSERAALFAQLEGGSMAAMFAASFPERTTGLVLFSAWAKLVRSADYPHGNTPEEREAIVGELLSSWGMGDRAWILASDVDGGPGFQEWFGKLERYAASPGTARSIMDLIGRTDVRDVLPSIRVPTLVLSRPEDDFFEVGHSDYLAEHIPGARHLRLPGKSALAVVGDSDAVLDEMEEFLTGARQERAPDRVLATVLFTDIVGSTQRAAELGDRSWRELLGRHDALVRRQIELHRGREVKSTGDGFLATFDGPARAVACARAAVEEVRALGIEIRAGLHTGECEVIGDDVGGLAVHIGARVSAMAKAGEALVSSTVKDLVVGSGIEFEDRGAHELKGVPGEWRVYAALT